MAQNHEKESYRFQINVREGAPGCSGDDTYTSEPYDTFADVYEAMIYFNPYRKWNHLRYIESYYIWRNECSKVYVYQEEDWLKIAIEDLVKLSVTEHEFDKIMNDMQKKDLELDIQPDIKKTKKEDLIA